MSDQVYLEDLGLWAVQESPLLPAYAVPSIQDLLAALLSYRFLWSHRTQRWRMHWSFARVSPKCDSPRLSPLQNSLPFMLTRNLVFLSGIWSWSSRMWHRSFSHIPPPLLYPGHCNSLLGYSCEALSSLLPHQPSTGSSSWKSLALGQLALLLKNLQKVMYPSALSKIHCTPSRPLSHSVETAFSWAGPGALQLSLATSTLGSPVWSVSRLQASLLSLCVLPQLGRSSFKKFYHLPAQASCSVLTASKSFFWLFQHILVISFLTQYPRFGCPWLILSSLRVESLACTCHVSPGDDQQQVLCKRGNNVAHPTATLSCWPSQPPCRIVSRREPESCICQPPVQQGNQCRNLFLPLELEGNSDEGVGGCWGKIPSYVRQEILLLLNLWKSEWNQWILASILVPPSLELGPLTQRDPQHSG